MSLTLHIVPHTHWDREWYLPFQTSRVRLVHLMDLLLQLLLRDATYRHFMLDGQAILLEDYLAVRPERADDVRRFVRMGRLDIGPWYVLPDEFLVAPESLLRNLMLGDRVCRRFGAPMPVGYTPDPFGHVAQLPQILRGFGLDNAVFRRGLGPEPTELWWAAPDGSRVLLGYLRDGYDNLAHFATEPEAFTRALREARDRLAPHSASGHLLLLAGTDHQEPQPELPDLIIRASGGELVDDQLLYSTLPAYVEALRAGAAAWPTVHGELRDPQRHHLLPGVLSTRMWIKQRNDAVETLLTRWAEPLAAWAEAVDVDDDAGGATAHVHLTGHEPLTRVHQPGALLWQAWRLLLQNHPHDSICGCGVDQVHREMAPRFDQAEQIGAAITAQSMAALAARVDTSGGSGPDAQPLVVFNPGAGPRTDVVTARLRLPDAPDALEVRGPDGQVLPHQVLTQAGDAERFFFRVEATPKQLQTYLGMLQGGRALNYVIHGVTLRRAGDAVHVLLHMGQSGEPDHAGIATARAELESLLSGGEVARFVIRTVIAQPRDLIFVAPNLPPHGYATFYVRSKGEAPAASVPDPAPKPKTADRVLEIETDHLQLTVDPADGTLTLTDKANGTVYAGLNRLVDGGDRGDEYNYCAPDGDQIIATPAAPPEVHVLESGPARQTLEVHQVYQVPRALGAERGARAEETVALPIVSRICLYPDVPRVDIETTVDNPARDHRLRVHFPVPVTVDHAHTGAHYYVARRPVPPVPPDLDTRDWAEQPAPTVPQRGWADVSDGQAGLMVANRGLPEVEFIPDEAGTTVALTLLRCVGWLSRDDLACRQGHAGPALPTPEAQCLGRHTFHYALIPHSGDWRAAHAQADAFRAPPRAVAAGVHPGSLAPAASMVAVTPEAFQLTAIKQPEGMTGLLARGVNLSDAPLTVRLRPWRPFERASLLALNEKWREPLLPDDEGAVTVTAGPWEVLTVCWRD